MRDVHAARFTREEPGAGNTFLVAAMNRRIERRHDHALLPRALERQLPDLGRVVDDVTLGAAEALKGQRLDRERLRRRQLFTRHLRQRHLSFLETPDWLTGDAVERVENA